MKKQINRWWVLAAAIVTNLSLGAGYAWSVFQTALLEVNPTWTLSGTSLAFSISFAMVPVGMIVFGPIVDKHGGKKIVFASGMLFGLGMFATGFVNSILMLYVTYGLVLGLGIGAGYGTATALTVKWFPDKKGLAGGLTAAGFGSGAIVLAPVATNMIETIGVYDTFKIIGGILLVVICAASFLMDKPPVQSKTPGVMKENDKDYKEMLKEGNFWILWAVYTFAATSGMMVIGHGANLAEAYSLGTGAMIVMIVGLANTLGRIVWGSISDKLGRYKTVMAMFVGSGAGLILLTFSTSLGSFTGVVGLVLIASSFGGFLGSFPGITAENWGASKSASNYGWMFTAYGIASILGPSLASTIKESTGSYSFALLLSAGMAMVGLGLTLWYMKRADKVSNKEKNMAEKAS